LKYQDPAEEIVFVELSIPVAIVLMGCSIQVGYTAIFQSVYQDERVLPFSKKATATNIIILVSKSVTIGAPFVNELEEPIPIVVIIVLSIMSIVIVSFFKSKEELDQMQKVDNNLAAMMSHVTLSKNGDAFN
jgi:hypothetical protein